MVKRLKLRPVRSWVMNKAWMIVLTGSAQNVTTIPHFSGYCSVLHAKDLLRIMATKMALQKPKPSIRSDRGVISSHKRDLALFERTKFFIARISSIENISSFPVLMHC